jgi:ComF family protein
VAETHAEASEPRCGFCRIEAYDFDFARSYGLYSAPLRDAILHLKFRRRERWGFWLGELLFPLWGSLAPQMGDPPRVLIPVPLHFTRERERGFNQAELLARGLWRRLRKARLPDLPQFEVGCLRRRRATPSQSGLDHRARMENVRRAFEVCRPERIRGRSVVLVDDVMTTGATASACARALKRAGAMKVILLTLARATPQFPDHNEPRLLTGNIQAEDNDF